MLKYAESFWHILKYVEMLGKVATKASYGPILFHIVLDFSDKLKDNAKCWFIDQAAGKMGTESF